MQSIQDITDRADKAFQEIRPISQLQMAQYSEPWKYPSVLRPWIKQGAKKLQQIFSRIGDTHRCLSFIKDCTGDSTLRTAIFRAKQNPISSVPLTILPNKPERIFNNSESVTLSFNGTSPTNYKQPNHPPKIYPIFAVIVLVVSQLATAVIFACVRGHRRIYMSSFTTKCERNSF